MAALFEIVQEEVQEYVNMFNFDCDQIENLGK